MIAVAVEYRYKGLTLWWMVVGVRMLDCCRSNERLGRSSSTQCCSEVILM